MLCIVSSKEACLAVEDVCETVIYFPLSAAGGGGGDDGIALLSVS